MKRKPKRSVEYDEWEESSSIVGTGSYQRIGDPQGKTKMKQIGFIRSVVRRPVPKKK